MTAKEYILSALPTAGEIPCITLRDREAKIVNKPVADVRELAETGTAHFALVSWARHGFSVLLRSETESWIPKTNLLIYSDGKAYMRNGGTNTRAPEFDLRTSKRL